MVFWCCNIFQKYNEVLPWFVIMYVLVDGNYLLVKGFKACINGIVIYVYGICWSSLNDRAAIPSGDKTYDEKLCMLCLLTFMWLVSKCVWYCRLNFIKLRSWHLTIDLTLLRIVKFIWWSAVVYTSLVKSHLSR